MGKGAQTFLCTNIGKFTKVAHTHTCKTHLHPFNNNYLHVLALNIYVLYYIYI